MKRLLADRCGFATVVAEHMPALNSGRPYIDTPASRR
jgi:hypothetical protein